MSEWPTPPVPPDEFARPPRLGRRYSRSMGPDPANLARLGSSLPPSDPQPEVGMLLDAARDLASTLDLHPLLELLLDHLGRVVEYAGTAILTLDDAGDE